MAVVTKLNRVRRRIGKSRNIMKTFRWWKKHAWRWARREIKILLKTGQYDNLTGIKPKLTSWDID